MSGTSQEIMLVRHPQTLANCEGRYIGRQDSPISDLGHIQVHWLERVVAAWEPDGVFASPLGRAYSTARAIAPAGVPLQVLDDLQEIDFGDAEGLTYEENEERGIRFDYVSGGPVAPGGESGEAFLARVVRAAQTVEGSGDRSLIVTHGGVMRQLLAHWLGLPVAMAWRFAIPNAAVAILRLAEGVGVLEGLTPPPDGPAEHTGHRRRPWHF